LPRIQGQKSPERSAETRVYVGIDVCKDWLDVDIHPIGRRFRVPNTPEGLKSLKRRIAAMPDALIVMEATAKYHRQPRRTLHAAGYAVAIVNPLGARLFAEAFGQLAKTDKLDARLLASECLKPEARSRAPEELEAGQEIVRARSAAIADRTALSNQRLASQTVFSASLGSMPRQSSGGGKEKLDHGGGQSAQIVGELFQAFAVTRDGKGLTWWANVPIETIL
jgi:transposase